MSLIALTSRDDDPAEFTNMLQSNLRLAPHTQVRCLGYGINVPEAGKEEIVITSGNDTFTVGFGRDGDQMGLNNVIIKIPHGAYPANGTTLVEEMTKAANQALDKGVLPGYCGFSAVAGTEKIGGTGFRMDAGSVEFKVQVQAPPDLGEGDWADYKSTENTDDQPLKIVNAPGATQLIADTEKENWSAAYDKEFAWFPLVPRPTAGVPNAQAYSLGDDALVFNLGQGADPTNLVKSQLCGGGYTYEPAMRQFQKSPSMDTPSAQDDWATGKSDIWCNHGWRLVEGVAPNSINIQIFRGIPNDQGGAGEIEVIPVSRPLADQDVAAGWDIVVSQRVVAFNPVVASPDADYLVSQIWIASNILAIPPTLVDSWELGNSQKFSNRMCKSPRLNCVWKSLSPGSGQAGDQCVLKVVNNSGKGNGDFPALAGWDGSVQTEVWGIAAAQAYDNFNTFPKNDGMLMELSKPANCNAVLGYEVEDFKQLAKSTSAVGWKASNALGTNEDDQFDTNQNFLIQIPNLPIMGRLGSTGTIAPIVACGRLKSVYNGDQEDGAYWYEFNNPTAIALNNDAEIILNEINVRLTDFWGVKIPGLKKHTTLMLEFTPNPPDGVRPHQHNVMGGLIAPGVIQ